MIKKICYKKISNFLDIFKFVGVSGSKKIPNNRSIFKL
jgi:hypothetical protein